MSKNDVELTANVIDNDSGEIVVQLGHDRDGLGLLEIRAVEPAHALVTIDPASIDDLIRALTLMKQSFNV